MKEIYGWVPWFGELAGKIAEGGETYLAEAAKRVAWRDDDDEQPLPLLKHGDENIDPFSFFYSLAQRGQDAGSRMRIFPSINKEFNMERQPPESDDAFVFPTPSYRAQVLFHNNGQGNPQLLWNLFRGALRGLDSVDPEDFVGALEIGYVGRVKLTQVLFLINPSQFIACDDKMAPFAKGSEEKERMKEIYGWVPWFGELAGKIAEGGETYLAEAAKRVAWRDDDDEQPLPLLKHGDENIDPFSFFYSLAQRGQDAGSRMRIFPSINKEFNMERQPPMESDDAFVFPTPSYRAQVLFHNNGQGNPQLLWNLFRGALRGLDSVDPELRFRPKGALWRSAMLVSPELRL